MPDTLQLMSGSLSAGLSLAQSVDTVVREGQEPIAGEFKRVLIETRLGVALDDALDGRGGAVREQGLRLGRDGDPDPASGRRQPGRAARTPSPERCASVSTCAARSPRSPRRASCPRTSWAACRLAFMLYLLLAKRDYVMPLFTEPVGLG